MHERGKEKVDVVVKFLQGTNVQTHKCTHALCGFLKEKEAIYFCVSGRSEGLKTWAVKTAS